jgi:hypothetical protein
MIRVRGAAVEGRCGFKPSTAAPRTRRGTAIGADPYAGRRRRDAAPYSIENDYYLAQDDEQPTGLF